MKDKPFFSIVIPTYNRAAILKNTLTTISNQTFTDFEIIVVDDGSNDNTQSVLYALANIDPRIKTIRQENKERGAARNNGFQKAVGEYVVFFDSDDIMHINHLDTLHKNILKENYPLFIATKFDFINESGKHRSSDINFLKSGYYDYQLFLNGNPLACNACVKKDNPTLHLFEENRKYSIKEDWMFLIQNLKSNKLFIIDSVTISMFDHQNRSMRSDNNLIIERTILALDWIMEKLILTAHEKRILTAHVNYFCAIHSYLDDKRKKGIRFILSAIKNGGIKLKYISLFAKLIIGRKLIQRNK